MDVEGPEGTTPPVADDEQSNWEMEKAEFERAQFAMNKELADLRERMEDLSRANGQMVGELARHGSEIKEHVSRQRALEVTRNELTDKNLKLECTVSTLKIEKEEREAAVIKATKDAQAALVETFALKDQIQQLVNEKVSLAHQNETFKQERKNIEFEREKYATEREVFADSKRWMMNEVAERDNRVSLLRIELSNKSIEGANERLQLESQINMLNAQLASVNEKVDMLMFNNADLIKKVEHTELTKNSEITNLEDEVRVQAELNRVLSHTLEEVKSAADNFKDRLEAQQMVLDEARCVLEDHQEKMSSEKAAYEESTRQLEEELAHTRIELAKANEMMKSMSDVKLNVSEEELSELAPAAAETVRLLRGSQSLSGVMLEHARVCGKLAETEEENTNLRTTLEELLEAIDQKRPEIESQRRVSDELIDKTMRFERQLDVAEAERKELVAQRDGVQRDLAYVRAELEKYQRDYEFVSRRNAELMYAVERQSRMSDPNWNERADEQLFQNIVQLQRRNVELESDIENAKTTAAQAAMNAQSAEMAALRADLAVTKKSEAELKTRVEQTKAAFDSLREKTEHFKELVRDSVSAAEARTARLRAEEAVAAKTVAEATIERLKAHTEEWKADATRRESDLLERIQNAEAGTKTVNETNVKLEALLETQKANTAAMEKEYTAAIKEKEVAVDELRKVIVADAEKERKLVDLGRQMLEAAAQAGSLKVKVRALEDELHGARLEVNALRMTTEGQRAILEKEEQVRSSVIEMAKFLSRVEAEQMSHANTQLDVLRLERDSLKTSTSRLSDQLTHARNDAKLTQQRLEKELELARSRLVEKEQQISRDEMELVDLRSKLASVQVGQFAGSDASGMTPDRLKREYLQLKTRTQFLESELDAAKSKLMEADAAQKRMDTEHAMSATHHTVLEENLKQSEQMGAMEKERLVASAKCFEERAQQLTDQLAANQLELNELRATHEQHTFDAEKESAELKRQVEVAAMHLETARRELEVANGQVTSLQNEVTRNASTLEQHHSIVRQFEEKIAEIETAGLRIQAELNNKTTALAAETTAKNEADQMREHVERLLQKQTAERDAVELAAQQKLAEYEDKLTQLSQQYEELATSLTTAPEVSMDPIESSSSSLIGTSSIVENMQSMMQFLRQAKDEATTRAMNAEIEMRRLRAETAEFEHGRNELLQKIRDLETEKIATAASLVDRARLIERVESLTAVQNVNQKLGDEKLRLEADLANVRKEKAEVDRQLAVLTAKSSEQSLKIAAANQEAIQRKREIEHLKQRTEMTARGPTAALQTQLDQLKTRLTAARQEATTASEQAKIAERAKLKAEENHKQMTEKLNQTRRIAIKYRDENAELKKITEGAVDSSDPCAPRLAALSKLHTEQVAQLNAQIEEYQKEIENLNVKTMRVSMLETRLKKSTEQLNELKEQNDKLVESNRQLTQSKSILATDVESKSATPTSSASSTTQKPIVRHTPTKSADTAVEPDQGTSSPFAKRPVFGKQFQSSSTNVVPPAPAPTSVSQSKAADKRPGPPSIPNEPIDIIPPVPSDNIPDPTPPTTNTFGTMLPVPHTFQSSARVPTQSLFSSSSTTTVQPQAPEKKNVLPNIESAPTTPGSNVTVSQATSSLNPTGSGGSGGGSHQMFSKSSTSASISTTTASPTDHLVLPEESVVEAAAEQSSLVSGSVDQQQDLAGNERVSDGESRDSTTAGGVSSSDGRRKRTANDFESSEAKRQRESPNEAVTSSETRQQINLAEIPELDDDDDGVLGLEHEVSDEDPNDNTMQEQQDDVIDLENDEEVLEDEMEVEEEGEDDDSFGNDEEEEYEAEHKAPAHDDGDDDDIVVLSDDDEQENDVENDAESLNDVDDDQDEEDDEDDEVEEIEMVEESNNDDIEEVLGGEDSQPSLDDQDREAASAVEEAEDEGRDPLAAIDEPSAPADPTGAAGVGSSGRVGGQEVQRGVRLPTGLREAEREDQCSSSNETAEERPQERLSARNLARLNRPMRGAKPTRGVYTPGRGRGRGGGSQ